METRSPHLAAALTLLLPGAGHLYLGRRDRALPLLVLSAGIGALILFSLIGPQAMRSQTSAVLLALPYLFVLVPALRDCYRGQEDQATVEPAWNRRSYVIWMLLVAGPMALPLLWRSSNFSRATKILWSTLVVGALLLALWAVVVAGPIIEEMLRAAQP